MAYFLELLQSEKYLVVCDDAWSQADWDAIHLPFPRNKCGSRVLITTRNSELGQAASNTEDAFIEKMRLVRLWTVEGLVQPIQGTTVEEVAESYLNELLSRSLVQVAEFCRYGRLKAVRVHDIVCLIILHKANEQNIATIINPKGLQCLPSKVRRLAIHGTFDNINELQYTCKSLRSLILHDSSGNISVNGLVKVLNYGQRLLKVLDLRDALLDEIPNEIFTLVHLKYLSLRNTKFQFFQKRHRALLHCQPSQFWKAD